MNADIESFEKFMALANHVSPERVHPFLSLLICVHPLPKNLSYFLSLRRRARLSHTPTSGASRLLNRNSRTEIASVWKRQKKGRFFEADEHR
jgi:hypothetical protein